MSTPETETPVRANAFGCITLPFLLIAAIPLAWGARNSWLDGQLARDGEVVPARVIELRHVPGNANAPKSRYDSAKSPVVMFTTRGGESRTAVGSSRC
jgi:hypothetical protein